MYLISQFLKITKGYYESIIFDFVKNDAFKINSQFVLYNLSSNFITKTKNNRELFNFLKKNRRIIKINKQFKDNFVNRIYNYSSPFTIEYLLVVNSEIINLEKIFLLCEKLKIPFLFLSTNEKIDVKNKLKTLHFPELITILTNNKNILKKNEFRLNYEFINKPFLDKDSLIVNLSLFTESQKHHTYYNRKLYIGKKGEIKNAPECEEIFGNIQDIQKISDIEKIIEQLGFQKYWYVHKEICDVCKDCEFRHMCVDNRLPYERKENEWFHKIECNYNPFICKWKGEKGYRTLEECGVISNKNEYTIDHGKIAKINNALWGEEE